jgi:hypothetical protein
LIDMDTGERHTTLRTALRPSLGRPRVVAVDDLARTVVNLLVNGADVRAEAGPGGVRVSVADDRGHQLRLVERPARSA